DAHRRRIRARRAGTGLRVDRFHVPGNRVMNRTTIDLWVGIFVALGLGAIVFLSMKVGNLASFKSEEGYHLEAHFDNIGGLKVRAPVKSAGVVVGRVAQIKLDPKSYEAVAVLNIE